MRSIRFITGIIFLTGMVLWIQACKNREKEKLQTVPATTNVAPAMPSSGVNETLPVLFISVADFKKLNGIYIFRFFIDDAFDLSIKGWKKPANDTPPVVDLNTSVLSNVKLGAGEYLGNLYLKANDVEQIIKKADGKFLNVKFVPFIDTDGVSNGQITYKIYLTNQVFRNRKTIPADSLNMLMDMAYAGDQYTTYMLNPSPPRAEQ